MGIETRENKDCDDNMISGAGASAIGAVSTAGDFST
jgi:hypothetical protein